MTLKFRPDASSKRSVLRNPSYRTYGLSFRPRSTVKSKAINEDYLGHVAGVVHYWCYHGYGWNRWKQARIRMKARSPVRGSIDYANTYSIERFI